MWRKIRTNETSNFDFNFGWLDSSYGAEVPTQGRFAVKNRPNLPIIYTGETSGFFGQGYDYAYSSAASSVELGCFLENEVIDTASGYSFMELFLQGLSNLEGVIGANNSITVDFSQTEMDAVNYLNFTSLLSVMAGLVVSGMAD